MRNVWKAVLLAALCLALWPALADAAPPKPKGKLVYSDDFNDPRKSGLEDKPEAADYGRGFHAPGVYVLNLHKDNDTRWALLPNKVYSEFTQEVDLWDDSDSFQGSVSQGVVFRAKDATHLYAVLIDPRNGKYAARKLDGADRWSDLIAWKDAPLIKQKSDVNHLRVDAQGDTFTIYMNGESLDSFSDSAYPSGGLGLIASNVDASDPLMHFDNARIYTTETGPAALPITGQSNERIPVSLAITALALLSLGVLLHTRRASLSQKPRAE